MVEKKKSSKTEVVILALVFVVFAAIVIAYSWQWDNVDNSSTDVTSFQYITSAKSDTLSNVASGNSESNIPTGKVNINTATKEELDILPGIGPKKAEAIIEYRENVSVFLNPEDIKKVSGIGDKIYEQIKDYIIVE